MATNITKAWRKLQLVARHFFCRCRFLFTNVRLEPFSYVEWGGVVSCKGGGSITLGRGTVIMSGAKLLTYGGDIRVGKHCSVNPHTILYGHGGLMIGDDVRIAAACVLVAANHGIARNGVPIRKQPLKKKGITIENDVWLGTGVRVTDGVVIARGSVIAAGAVVTKSTNEFGIYGGVPAKLIRIRQ